MPLALFDNAVRRLMQPRTLIAASLFRIAVALYMLTVYLVHFGQRALLWGPDAVYPYQTFLRGLEDPAWLSLYALSGAAWYGEALYWIGLLAAVLYLAGIAPRLTGIALFWLSFSLFSRNPWITDGGTTFMRLMLFYVLFAETGAYFALGARRRLARFRSASPGAGLVRITHTFAITACLAQLAIVYATSVLYKMQGHMWQDGTALYYILRSNTYNITPLSGLIYNHPILVCAATYGTLFVQMAFPWLMWSRKVKPFLFVVAASLHVGIAISMNLLWFSWIMCAADLLLFTDDMLVSGYRSARLLWSRALARFTLVRPVLPSVTASPARARELP